LHKQRVFLHEHIELIHEHRADDTLLDLLEGRAMSSARVSEDAALELRTLRGAFVFFVRQPSPWIMALAISVFLATRIMAGRWRIADLIVALAVAASWHIQERLMHEYVLHMKARPLFGATLAKRLSKHHQRHHRDPWRTETLFIIRRAFLFTLPGVFGVLFAITRDIRLALSGSCAYFVTLLSYEWVHCLIHTSYEPRTACIISRIGAIGSASRRRCGTP
jgi:hypothetical protein